MVAGDVSSTYLGRWLWLWAQKCLVQGHIGCGNLFWAARAAQTANLGVIGWPHSTTAPRSLQFTHVQIKILNIIWSCALASSQWVHAFTCFLSPFYWWSFCTHPALLWLIWWGHKWEDKCSGKDWAILSSPLRTPTLHRWFSTRGLGSLRGSLQGF